MWLVSTLGETKMPNGEGQVRIVWPEEGLWPQGGYGNAILVNHTPWDFTLRIGHVILPAITPGQEPDTVEVEVAPVAQFTMPPSAIRELAQVLQQQIATYIQTYGETGGIPPGPVQPPEGPP
jgi:hypothetical protein